MAGIGGQKRGANMEVRPRTEAPRGKNLPLSGGGKRGSKHPGCGRGAVPPTKVKNDKLGYRNLTGARDRTLERVKWDLLVGKKRSRWAEGRSSAAVGESHGRERGGDGPAWEGGVHSRLHRFCRSAPEKGTRQVLRDRRRGKSTHQVPSTRIHSWPSDNSLGEMRRVRKPGKYQTVQ